ncbi:hypothetical protein Nepgr_022718 [Nepenthes gracilis]|uniref:Cytochrome P450 n=1 Tax=Nepenthes gracilis TaxID=150966 RepID=A0AAD3T1C8_NEPGR|nr:hypothetical protein Nepgr_022718 [Nepenthes gracilis]
MGLSLVHPKYMTYILIVRRIYRYNKIRLYISISLLKAMLEPVQFLSFFIFFLLPWLLLPLTNKIFSHKKLSPSQSSSHLPKSYPIIGCYLAFRKHMKHPVNWLSEVLQKSPTSTFVLDLPLVEQQVHMANPENIKHILKTQFALYPKGSIFTSTLHDLLGQGIINVDGDLWNFQRQIASHEFTTNSLNKFIEMVVDAELSGRLIPILSDAAKNRTVLDIQDILTRFTFDNICQIAFGYDPEGLSPSLPESQFTSAFDEAGAIITERFKTIFPMLWKIKRFLNIGTEKKLRKAVHVVREFARTVVRQKKKELEGQNHGSLLESNLDLLSRFLRSGHIDEEFVTDIVISFILAGRDTTSATLTWFFWLLSRNPSAEDEIMAEISAKNSSDCVSDKNLALKEMKHMVYTHAALCETMRLYPPVPVDSKEPISDDVLPDGTKVKKGTRVVFHPYAMGRSEKLWGNDWPEFRPERWLERGPAGEEVRKWSFVPRDPYTYPVFQAGPRICLGREMAFLQMKRVVAGVLSQFRLVPAVEDSFEPVFIPAMSALMKGGLPVRIEERKMIV